jgi:hypothetical protein
MAEFVVKVVEGGQELPMIPWKLFSKLAPQDITF